jgi:hypothetical protein
MDATIEDNIRRRLRYSPTSGKLFWNRIEEKTREDKIHNSRNAGTEAGCRKCPDGYYRVRVAGKLYLSHRLAWLLHTGDWPRDFIDHINHERADNRSQNLRDVTRSVQNRNTCRRNNNTSGTTGVSKHSSGVGWCAEIKENGVRLYLGYFKVKSEAVKARKVAQESMDFSDSHGGSRDD